MTKTEIHTEASQAERRKVAENDRRVREGATSFHQFASSEADAVGGRYSAVAKSTVVGSGPVAYPSQPATSPWASDPVGPEAPLGYSVDETPIVGEAFEVEKSMREARGSGSTPPTTPRQTPRSGDGAIRAGLSRRSPHRKRGKR